MIRRHLTARVLTAQPAQSASLLRLLDAIEQIDLLGDARSPAVELASGGTRCEAPVAAPAPIDVYVLDARTDDDEELFRQASTAGSRIPCVIVTDDASDRLARIAPLERAVTSINADQLTIECLRNSVGDVVACAEWLAAFGAASDQDHMANFGDDTGIWDWRMVQNEVYYSPRFYEMIGAAGEPQRPSLNTWFSRVHGDDLPDLQRRMTDYLARRTPRFEQRFRVLHAEGTYRPAVCAGIAMRLASGMPYRMVGMFQEVTSAHPGS